MDIFFLLKKKDNDSTIFSVQLTVDIPNWWITECAKESGMQELPLEIAQKMVGNIIADVLGLREKTEVVVIPVFDESINID